MTKDVNIAIRGMQFVDSLDGDEVETIQKGQYYFKNGMHYVLYEEPAEHSDENCKIMIKFNDSEVNVLRRGEISANMAFYKENKNYTCYKTPYGSIMVGLDTRSVKLQETEKELQVQVDYSLDINYEFLADCQLHIRITQKDEPVLLDS